MIKLVDLEEEEEEYDKAVLQLNVSLFILMKKALFFCKIFSFEVTTKTDKTRRKSGHSF